MATGCLCLECINFSDDDSCNSVTNVIFENITSTSFDIGWGHANMANDYVVEFKTDDGMTWFSNPSVTAPLINDQLVGLTPDELYQVRVKTNCTSTSCYSLTFKIKTLPLEV